MRQTAVACVTIAGLDPSHGAGLTRDINTFECAGVRPFAVCTALTIQDDTRFEHVKWIKPTHVLRQLNFILDNHSVNAVKIGLIENERLLVKIVRLIKSKKEDIDIVWDPILRSSTGYEFHSWFNSEELEKVCKHCTVITPNRDEIKQLIPKTEDEAAARALTRWCPVLLKGGHDVSAINDVTDMLFMHESTKHFTRPRLNVTLHGTGCRYSSALTAYLAKGAPLSHACSLAGDYVYNCLLEKTGMPAT